MNILYFYPKITPLTGGGKIHGYYLSKNLSEIGVKLYSKKNSDLDFIIEPSIYQYLKIKKVYIRYNNFSFSYLLILLLRYVFRKEIYLEVNAPDYELLLQKSKFKYGLSRIFNPFAFSAAKKIIVVSEEVKLNIPKKFSTKVHVINNGGQKFRKVEKNVNKVVYATSAYSWHDFSLLSDFAKKNPEYEFIVLVNGDIKLEKLNNIKVKVSPSREVVERHLAEASFGLAIYSKQASTFYNSPLKIYEYLANDIITITNVKNTEISNLMNVVYSQDAVDLSSIKPNNFEARTWKDVALETLACLKA